MPIVNFKTGYKTCTNCGKRTKNYPYFESQWTVAQIEDKLLYFCPKCWGIPDPAPAYCKAHGHDFEMGVCVRCNAPFKGA